MRSVRQAYQGLALKFKLAACLALAGILTACGTAAIRDPVPGPLSNQAEVLGLTSIRFWGDEIPPNFKAIVAKKLSQMRATRPQLFKPGARPTFSFLTVSGGGSDGAFGAGLLSGWSERGTRPQFEIVTGVSTGSLIAPFAFLGRAHDPALKKIYTQYSTKDLVTEHPIRGLVGGTSIASNKPLAGVIAQYVDHEFLAEIAREHATGRRLLVGTTNLDAQRPVIWDMGAIASSGNPEAIHLFRNVLLASAAIPGVFPPVFISVTADGKTYQEMHVDGGTTQQVFLLPGQIQAASIARMGKVNPRRRVYIIRNGRVSPEYKVVKAGTLSIAERSVSTLIKYQGIGDLYEIYDFSRRNRIAYRLAYIPGDFPDTSKEAFDTVYMTKLYDLGYGLGKQGYKWKKVPPGSGDR